MVKLSDESHRPAMMTMEVVAGEESASPGEIEDHPQEPLLLGPYAVSPLRGLHFYAEDDTASS